MAFVTSRPKDKCRPGAGKSLTAGGSAAVKILNSPAKRQRRQSVSTNSGARPADLPG